MMYNCNFKDLLFVLQNMRIKAICLILFLFFGFDFFAQTFVLSGKITDGKNESLPFASVFVKGTTIGTNSNVDGFYTLKLEPGQYEIVFQYVGYKKEIKSIKIDGDLKFNAVLSADSYELKEVTVKAGEDPAYPIIRQAIKKRKFYLQQVNSYSCRAYIKGLQRLKDIPKLPKFMKAATNGEPLDSSMLGLMMKRK
jgi:hypothetical protein